MRSRFGHALYRVVPHPVLLDDAPKADLHVMRRVVCDRPCGVCVVPGAAGEDAPQRLRYRIAYDMHPLLHLRRPIHMHVHIYVQV
jgi:hypothetical protein